MWTPWSGAKGESSTQQATQQQQPSSLPPSKPSSSPSPSPLSPVRTTSDAAPAASAGVGAPVNISQEAALSVVKLTLAASTVSGLGGALYGALRAQPAILYGVQSGMNTFVFAFPILAMREYVVSPLLESATAQSSPPTAVPSMHFNNIAASAISGCVAGGAMSAYFRGRARLVPGAITFTLLCAGLQLTANELRIVRIKFLAYRMRTAAAASQRTQSVEPQQQNTLSAHQQPFKAAPQHDLYSAAAAADGNETSSNTTSASIRTPSSSEFESQSSPSWFSRVSSKLASYSPIRSISDDEYESMLLQRRQEALQRLRTLDNDIAQEEAAQHRV